MRKTVAARHTRVFLKLIQIVMMSGVFGLFGQVSGERRVEAKVERSVVEYYSLRDVDAIGVRSKLSMRLTNRSGIVIRVPKPKPTNDKTNRAQLVSMDVKGPDGHWRRVFHASFYGFNNDGRKSASCVSLPIGGSAEYEDLVDEVPLLRKQLIDVGQEPTIRLVLQMACEESDKREIAVLVHTEPFVVKLGPMH